ncbi:HpcH/HpaI aldolase family protein [Nakamurella deserti]|uniref:HpcH/HpaI aldolase family protein n=1 Tax=Nakamurella deserti TaxID=2164074 RepID=UPI000DBE0077|nr:aldolase/citrate lyase family protein [Nakamurella deserti]
MTLHGAHTGPSGEGGARIGAWSGLAGGGTAEILARSGPDWLVLDAQHGAYEGAAVAATLHDLAGIPVPVWVRLPDDSAAGIGRVLDAGAAGVIVPMVDTPQQAARIAAACRYPPAGVRSWGPTTALYGRSTPAADAANSRVLCAVMVETRSAVADVTAIAATPGVDMVFVGPFDLALSLGVGLDDLLADDADDSPLPSVVRACRAAGIRAGAFAGAVDRGGRLAGLGFTDVAVLTDAGLLASSAEAELARWRGGPTAPRRAAY